MLTFYIYIDFRIPPIIQLLTYTTNMTFSYKYEYSLSLRKESMTKKVMSLLLHYCNIKYIPYMSHSSLSLSTKKIK
jgi:hypothetical protein